MRQQDAREMFAFHAIGGGAGRAADGFAVAAPFRERALVPYFANESALAIGLASMCSITWSISLYSNAPSAHMKRSGWVSRSTCSKGWPVCLIRMLLSLALIFLNSLAWIMMSSAVPSMPASGWWIMIRALGSAWRLP